LHPDDASNDYADITDSDSLRSLTAVGAELETDFEFVLSADIVGSTALYESSGDRSAQAIVAQCMVALNKACRDHDGIPVAEVGDQIIARFRDAAAAANAASEIHIEMLERKRRDIATGIRMRVGLHYGSLPQSVDPVATQTTKIANWAAANAKPDQTLATRAFVDQLPRIFRAVSRYVDDETWEYISLEHVELYEIIWDVESITAFNGEQPTREDNSYDGVVFTYGQQTFTTETARPVISIGRHKENDLVINKDLVSRQHLSAQFSRGRCTVTDNSTNGSLVRLDNGEEYKIKRESFRLNGSGVIIAGMPAESDSNSDSGFEISFRCV